MYCVFVALRKIKSLLHVEYHLCCHNISYHIISYHIIYLLSVDPYRITKSIWICVFCLSGGDILGEINILYFHQLFRILFIDFICAVIII